MLAHAIVISGKCSNLDTYFETGNCMVDRAAQKDSVKETFEALLLSGLTWKYSVLSSTVLDSDMELLTKLVENDEDPYTALHAAALSNEPEVVCRLLIAGSHVDAQDNLKRTPLLIAAIHGNVNCVELLIKAGADFNIVDHQESSPLHLAARYCHT